MTDLPASAPAPEVTGLPRHIAIIMDGNGRWALQRGLPRIAGHRRGVEVVRDIAEACAERGIAYLTLFAFSSENWRRPREEVAFLMRLFASALEREVSKMHENGIRLRVVGDLTRFKPRLQRQVQRAEAKTAHDTRMTLTIAINYGGRWDILQAARKSALEHFSGRLPQERAQRQYGARCGQSRPPSQSDGGDPAACPDMQNGEAAPEKPLKNALAALDEDRAPLFDETDIAKHLAIAYAPEPDLFIRTGGERRISNFLLWQLAYTELYFADTFWPDFNASALDLALDWYRGRERRFGLISAQLETPPYPVKAL